MPLCNYCSVVMIQHWTAATLFLPSQAHQHPLNQLSFRDSCTLFFIWDGRSTMLAAHILPLPPAVFLLYTAKADLSGNRWCLRPLLAACHNPPWNLPYKLPAVCRFLTHSIWSFHSLYLQLPFPSSEFLSLTIYSCIAILKLPLVPISPIHISVD